ncbi:MAG: serine/threonine protein kinase [Cyanobacteria bacterium REEB67]|nr:serine/threonine protein kinase [Cyanobacteria bacterium REEB67]
MAENVPTETEKGKCPRCGRRVASEKRAGSLTSYLFRAFDCTCDQSISRASDGRAKAEAVEDDIDFCPICGLQIVAKSRNGSLTGFLFQSTRCQCPADQSFAPGGMNEKFWKLKKTGASTIFISSDHLGEDPDNSSIGLAAGAIIGGVYQIEDLIGRGGMGEVYRAIHQALDKQCALKVIPPEQVTEIGWRRFQLEAKAVAKLDHINLVRVTDLGIHDGCLPYFAMEYIEGNNLADLLAAYGPMPLEMVLEVFMQVCDGVEFAHRNGILHRDLKPANIMLTSEGSGKKLVKILDFGLVKLTRQDRNRQSLTSVGDVFGSPFYMSPEQCNGEKIDNRADIYSIGCTMFECLTGRPPFVGWGPSSILISHVESEPPSLESVTGPGKFPNAMEVVVAKLLRKNPVERYQNLSQLRADLALVGAGKDVLPVYQSRSHLAAAMEEKESRQSGRTSQKNFRTMLTVVTAALVATAIVTIGGVGLYRFMTPKKNTINFGEKTSSVSAISREDIETAVTKRASGWDGKPFVRGIVEHNGVLCRHWYYPINLEPPFALREDSTGITHDLHGDVYMPVSERVWLVVKLPLCINPLLLEGLEENAFDGVDSTGPGINVDFVLNGAGELTDYKSVIRAMMGNSTWTNSDCKRSLMAINSSDHATELRLYAPYDGDTLKHLEQMKHMKHFLLKFAQPSPPVLDCLAGFKEAADLIDLDVETGADQSNHLSALEGCSKLKILTLDRLACTKKQTAILAKLAALETLNVPDLAYRPDLAQDLKKIKTLKNLQFTRKGSWNEAKCSGLATALSGIHVTCDLPGSKAVK